MTATRLLIAQDDDVCRAFLTDNLTADGHTVEAVQSHHAASAFLRRSVCDLLVADVNGSTLGLVDWVRAGGDQFGPCPADLPVIVLRSEVDEFERVRLLERGADDVIAKPFVYPELRARIGAVLRRTAPRLTPPVTSAGPLRIEHHTRTVSVEDRSVSLSDTEFRLLCQLASNPTRVFTRAELMRDVWGYVCEGRTRTLDTHVHRLRRRLGGPTPLIVNVWGVGYALLSNHARAPRAVSHGG